MYNFIYIIGNLEVRTLIDPTSVLLFSESFTNRCRILRHVVRGGMLYPYIEINHKNIDPLLLDDLKVELIEIKEMSTEKTRKQELVRFQLFYL